MPVAVDRLVLSARACTLALMVARAIADLEGEINIGPLRVVGKRIKIKGNRERPGSDSGNVIIHPLNPGP